MNGARRATWTAVLAGLALAAAGCGQDELKCPAGQTACGGACVDTASDPNNCRFCGVRCPTGASCTPAGCQCPAGQADCGGGACVSLSADPNCGACGHACGLLGTCSTLTVPASCDCGTYAKCGPAASPECVDVNANDPFNCGDCGILCGQGTCGGTPQICTCDAGWTRCDPANPRCVDLLADEQHCGDCAIACLAGETCCAGACVNTLTDPSNCGACGNACAGGQICSNGHCCPGGDTWCGTSCVDTASDPMNCGACGVRCGLGMCVGGACGCNAGATFCAAANPRCVDLMTDERHCGTCVTTCSGNETCSLGKCCATGSTNCSGTCVNTSTDVANCGTCGHACPGNHVCSAGVCTCPPTAPLTCGTTCCPGALCCSADTCQLAHPNGLGQSYFHCAPLGTPGQGSGYGQEMAIEAAKAWRSGGTGQVILCQTGDCWAYAAGGDCAVWCYQGMMAGYVNLPLPSFCQCPDLIDPQWR